MLHRVGHVDLAPVDARLGQAIVEEPSRRTDEGMTLEILAVPGLLSDQEEPGADGTLSKDRLGGAPPQWTGLAGSGGVPQRS